MSECLLREPGDFRPEARILKFQNAYYRHFFFRQCLETRIPTVKEQKRSFCIGNRCKNVVVGTNDIFFGKKIIRKNVRTIFESDGNLRTSQLFIFGKVKQKSGEKGGQMTPRNPICPLGREVLEPTSPHRLWKSSFVFPLEPKLRRWLLDSGRWRAEVCTKTNENCDGADDVRSLKYVFRAVPRGAVITRLII